ncbi:MAG: hypothetical protein U0W65_10945 [Bacteroidia bacterium]
MSIFVMINEAKEIEENNENDSLKNGLSIEKLKTFLGKHYNESEFTTERLKEIVYSIKTFARILMKCQLKMENNKIENEEAENMGEGKIISLSQSAKQIETETYLKQAA